MKPPLGEVQQSGGATPTAATAAAALAFAAVYVVIAWLLAEPARHSGAWLAGSLVLGGALALLSAIDAQTYRLPDTLTLPLAAAGLLLPVFFGDQSFPWRAFSAAAAFSVLALVALAYRKVRGHAGLGLGDAKLFAAAGAWLGAEHLAAVMLIATLSALAFLGARALYARRLDLTARVAFGPFISLGFWTAWCLAT